MWIDHPSIPSGYRSNPPRKERNGSAETLFVSDPQALVFMVLIRLLMLSGRRHPGPADPQRLQDRPDRAIDAKTELAFDKTGGIRSLPRPVLGAGGTVLERGNTHFGPMRGNILNSRLTRRVRPRPTVVGG